MKIKYHYDMAYNIQVVMDYKNKFIVGNEVLNEENDIHSLYSTITKTEKDINLIFKNITADSGYDNIVDIKKLQSNKRNIYVNPRKNIIKNIFIVYDEDDKKELESINKKRSKKLVEIKYNPEEDVYICENNKKFIKTNKTKKMRLQSYFVYKCKDCEGCNIKSRCTSAKSNHRELYISTLKDEIREFKKNMKKPIAVEFLKKRKTIEHLNANLKTVFGRNGFHFVGIKKVQNFVSLCEITYNIKHLCNIEKQEIILQNLKTYFNKKI